MLRVGHALVGVAIAMVAMILWGMQRVMPELDGPFVPVLLWAGISGGAVKLLEAILIVTEKQRFDRWDALRAELSKALSKV